MRIIIYQHNAHNLPFPDLDKEVNVQLNILTTLSPSQHCPHILPTSFARHGEHITYVDKIWM